MKKVKSLLVAIFAVILLVGCGMKEKVGLIISNDKKVSFEIKILMDDELIDTMLSMSDGGLDDSGNSKTYTDEERWNYFKDNLCTSTTSEEDYTCETVTEGNYKGAVLKVTSKDISEFVALDTAEKVNLASIGESRLDSLFKLNDDVYSSNFEYQMSDTGMDYSQYRDQMSAFSVTFEVTLPNKPISNNADEVSSDGLTLTWDLSKGVSKSLDFSFKFDGTGTNTTKDPKTTTDTKTTTTTDDNKVVSNKDEGGMSTTTLILIIVCSVLGLALISILIIIFARKSTKNPIPASPVSQSAAAFKNPEIHPTKAEEPTQAPVEEPTETEKPAEEEATKEESKKEE
ncbi:MAG: hypothetical protein IKF36_04135 [Bacilli bacterium]|nr:hypothetical protein [Bacilli bacterium]